MTLRNLIVIPNSLVTKRAPSGSLSHKERTEGNSNGETGEHDALKPARDVTVADLVELRSFDSRR